MLNRFLNACVFPGLLLLGLNSCSSPLADFDSASSYWSASPVQLSDHFSDGERFMDIRLLGTLELRGSPKDDVDMDELSGLAWDENSNTLFAISDRGWLHRFRPRFESGQLAALSWLGHSRLKGSDGKRLKGQLRDSEGLAIIQRGGQTQLLVSFEGKPRIGLYDTQGNWLGERELPPSLADIDSYRGRNKALEALAYHPELGWVTGPEKALRRHGNNLSLHSESGTVIQFPPEPDHHSALTGLSTAPNGDLIFLERRYRGKLVPLQIRVRAISPSTGNPPRTIARFDNAEGWAMDNFEGIAHHRDNHYFIISDNNGSHAQRTLLMYIEHIRE